MTSRHVSPVTCHPQKGVALVITLIMLAVITFMAVTFLAVSRREAGSVTTTRDQTTARLAADTALERVKAEMSAVILGTTNAYNFGLLVSTNFVNWDGFDPTPPVPSDPRTNVNYGYQNDVAHSPLTANQALQNLANLLLNPRPPVFITNRFFANSNEFRFYHDLNRNGRYDTNGWWPIISGDQNKPFYGTNGNLFAATDPVPLGGYISNHFIGDPEWIGILERPDRPHSATNRFVARYAYIVVPTGKTLDVNYIHNQAKTLPARTEGFLRNQGVGSWEINLAAFLVDLNTNMWLVPSAQGGYGSPYFYSPNLNNIGAGFDDAFPLLRYRYGIAVNPPPLQSVVDLFGAPGMTAFNRDFVDGYTRGPLMTTYWGWGVPADQDIPRTSLSWSGADARSQYFTTQDFYDKTKTSVNNLNAFGFTDRLLIAGTNNPNNSLYGPSSYDRYTFYRLLAQLGTDSAIEPPDKINLNYINTGPFRATNFVSWDDLQVRTAFGRPGSEVFFTTAADKLLRQYTGEWWNQSSNLFWATFGLTNSFSVTNIPVWVNNRFVYTPGVHRLLQLAANIYDSMTNHAHLNDNGATNLPTVFRPQFERRPNNDIYIANFVEVNSFLDIQSRPLRTLVDTNVAANVQPNDLIFGVPLVIGAKKGLPNFNEFAMQTVFQATRKLEIHRPSVDAPRSQWTTNMMYVVGLSNIIGAEAWNSYRAGYARPVDIYVTNYMIMTLTNDYGLNKTLSPTIGRYYPIPNPSNSVWSGYNNYTPNASFVVPLRTNINFIPDSAFVPSLGGFTTNWALAWDTSQMFRTPQWGLAVTNRLQFIVVDRASLRLIDYVQLEGLNGSRQLSEEIRDPDDKIGFEGLWSTNLLAGKLPQGILNQITISLGINGANAADWKPYDLGSHSSKDFEIDKFRVFCGLSPLKIWPNPIRNEDLGTTAQVPFTPTKRRSQLLSWQANDPLVHYTPGDLAYLKTAGSIITETLQGTVQPIKNIGFLNERYQPWGEDRLANGDPTKYSTALKDPGVAKSDDWQFPTNKFPNIGWLGRVHRGSPWQTIYMKSSDVDTNTSPTAPNPWQDWTGNGNYNDAMLTRPMNDRMLFDVFTTAFNENAARGQLSVNQSGLAAWSALFSGVVALTNTFPNSPAPVTNYTIIEPAGIYDPFNTNTWSPLVRIVNGINRERARGFLVGTNSVYAHPGQTFRHVGDIFSVPELTDASPYLNVIASSESFKKGLNDAIYEWLPQQVMSLLQVGEPRFVVYSFGQTLRPAPASIVTSGTFQGMCTNYQVTAEAATRAVVRIEGAPTGTTSTSPRVVIENFNVLPPD